MRRWAGLVTDDAGRADLTIFGALHDDGAGEAAAPAAVRDAASRMQPVSQTFRIISGRVFDMGDASGSTRSEVFADIEGRAVELARAKKRFVVIGGSGAISIPAMRGVDRSLSHDFGIVRFSASLGMLGAKDGATLRAECAAMRATELDRIGGPEDIVWVGARTAYAEEAHFASRKDVTVLTPAKIRRAGIKETLKKIRKRMDSYDSVYVSIDMSVLDPAFAPCATLRCPGGLDTVELTAIARGVLTSLPIVGMDITGFAPSADCCGPCAETAARIILDSLPKSGGEGDSDEMDKDGETAVRTQGA